MFFFLYNIILLCSKIQNLKLSLNNVKSISSFLFKVLNKVSLLSKVQNIRRW